MPFSCLPEPACNENAHGYLLNISEKYTLSDANVRASQYNTRHEYSKSWWNEITDFELDRIKLRFTIRRKCNNYA